MIKLDEYYSTYVQQWNTLLKDYNVNNFSSHQKSSKDNANRRANTNRNMNNKSRNNTKNTHQVNYIEEWNNLLKDYN